MNAQPVERELTDDEYEDMLDEVYGEVDICGMKYSSGRALRELDPIAFRCGKVDWESELEPNEWECEKCGTRYDNEDEAEECCQEEDE